MATRFGTRLPFLLAPALALTVALAQGRLGEITFALGEEDAEPVGVTSTFPADVEAVYAFFEFADLAPTDVVTGTWYHGSEVLIAQATTVSQVVGRHVASGTLFFSLLLTSAELGSYRLDIGIGGAIHQSATFEVVAAATTEASFDVPGLTAGYAADGSIAALHRYPAGLERKALSLLVAHQGLTPGRSWGWRVHRAGTIVAERLDLSWNGAPDGLQLVPLDAAWVDGVYDLDLFLDGARVASDSVVIGSGTPGDLPVLQQDAFETPDPGWTPVVDADGRVATEGGRLLLAFPAVANTPGWSVFDAVHADAVVEVDATTVAGPDDNAYGVVVRYQDPGNFHAFLASADGYFAAIRFLDGRVEWDQPWLPDRAFGSIELGGATNRLRVTAVGSELRFYANGRLLLVTTASWSEGRSGVFAASLGQPGVEVAFDDWHVWGLGPATGRPTSVEPVLALACGASATGISGGPGTSMLVGCPAGCPPDDRLWGTDVYTDDSNICVAAVHAGVLPAGAAGTIRLTVVEGRASYQESTRHGVVSRPYSSWGRSFAVERP